MKYIHDLLIKKILFLFLLSLISLFNISCYNNKIPTFDELTEKNTDGNILFAYYQDLSDDCIVFTDQDLVNELYEYKLHYNNVISKIMAYADQFSKSMNYSYHQLTSRAWVDTYKKLYKEHALNDIDKEIRKLEKKGAKIKKGELVVFSLPSEAKEILIISKNRFSKQNIRPLTESNYKSIISKTTIQSYYNRIRKQNVLLFSF